MENFDASWADHLLDSHDDPHQDDADTSTISVGHFDDAWGDAFSETGGGDDATVDTFPQSHSASSSKAPRGRGRPKGTTGTRAWRQLRTLV